MRLVLDTNEFVHALMRPAPLATFVMAWASQRFDVICSAALLDEYLYVLTYPRIANRIEPELLRAFHDYLLESIEIVEASDIGRLSRDPEDDKVLAVAFSGNINYLITEDNDLRTPEIIQLLSANGIQVITMPELLQILD